MTPSPSTVAQDVNIVLCQGDLPGGVHFPNGMVAVDTETTGLDVRTEKLCLCQLGDGNGNVWLVKFQGTDYNAPNLKALMENPRVTKLFHYARFDMAILQRCLGIGEVYPVFCTKIASKLVRGETARHNLRTLVQDYLAVTLDKSEQLSDWTVPELSDTQKAYAASDVLYLHGLYEKLAGELAEKGLSSLMDQCLKFLPTRVELDLCGFPEADIFGHH